MIEETLNADGQRHSTLLQDVLELMARNELTEAHRRLDEHIERGGVPEDLKRSGG